jgi:hypothetical protein
LIHLLQQSSPAGIPCRSHLLLQSLTISTMMPRAASPSITAVDAAEEAGSRARSSGSLICVKFCCAAEEQCGCRDGPLLPGLLRLDGRAAPAARRLFRRMCAGTHGVQLPRAGLGTTLAPARLRGGRRPTIPAHRRRPHQTTLYLGPCAVAQRNPLLSQSDAESLLAGMAVPRGRSGKRWP